MNFRFFKTAWIPNQTNSQKLLLSFCAMAQHHNGAIRNDSLLRPAPRTLRLFDVKSTYDIGNPCRNNALLTLNFMLLENAPCVKYKDKGLCFLLEHRNIIATAYYTPRNEVRGVYWNHHVRLSVRRPSVCRPHLGFRRITAFPLHLSSWNFTCRLPMSQGCAL